MNIYVKSGMKAGELCANVFGQEITALENLGFTCKKVSPNVASCRGPESAKSNLDSMGLKFRYKVC